MGLRDDMTLLIGLHSTVRQADNLAFCELDGETALMSTETGRYYGLDPVGSRIWALIASDRLVSELCALLLEEFDVEPAHCAHHVLTFLNELARNHLVVVDEPAR
jgi:Coenzyme PQQ synthesis protein D (PqqD)